MPSYHELMTSWKISRHAEWDLMYRAGLTVREIADICHCNPGTVHRHVRMRDYFEPGYQAIHAEALMQRHEDRPSTAWKKNLFRLRDFFTYNERLPSYSGSDLESALYRWLCNQRRSFLKGTMSQSKINLLNEIPGWSESLWLHEMDERWLLKLADFEVFVAEFNRMPRYKKYVSERERILGVWLHSQHQRRAQGTLRFDRKKILDSVVPGWRSHS